MTFEPAALARPAQTLAVSSPPAGSGVAAAAVVAVAAAVCESVARASVHTWADASGTAVQAVRLRMRADAAAAANAASYARARDALHPTAATTATSGRDASLRAALLAAADTLLTIAATAADCVGLAAEMVGRVASDLQPDIVGAAELALGAAVCVVTLLEVNLALTADDPRRERAREFLISARTDRTAARRVLGG